MAPLGSKKTISTLPSYWPLNSSIFRNSSTSICRIYARVNDRTSSPLTEAKLSPEETRTCPFNSSMAATFWSPRLISWKLFCELMLTQEKEEDCRLHPRRISSVFSTSFSSMRIVWSKIDFIPLFNESWGNTPTIWSSSTTRSEGITATSSSSRDLGRRLWEILLETTPWSQCLYSLTGWWLSWVVACAFRKSALTYVRNFGRIRCFRFLIKSMLITEAW